MKKNDVFTFTAPNGVEVTAVVISPVGGGEGWENYVCYAQNRIFLYTTEFETTETGIIEHGVESEILVDYAILPDYDELIKLMEYPQWEQNLEAEIQGMNDR